MATILPTQFSQDHADAEQPSYVLFASAKDGSVSAQTVAARLALYEVNATVADTVGSWRGHVEHGVRIDIQADREHLNDCLIALSFVSDGIGWVHVTDDDGQAHYVRLNNGDDATEETDDTVDRLRAAMANGVRRA